jgi:hypothetical protein
MYYSTNIKYINMHDLKAIYDKVKECILNTSKQYFVYGENSRFYPRLPKMSDLEVICLSIAAECTQIDSENLLWSKIQKDYPTMFSKLSHRTKFNRRRKQLRPIMSECLTSISELIHDNIADETLVIDSMPIPTCKLARERSSTVCRKINKDEILANKGRNIIMGGWFIGYKLHLITTVSGVFKDFMITGANVHDNLYLKLIDENDAHLRGYNLLGDKGYIGNAIQLSLFENYQIKLEIPYRCNQKEFKKYPHELKIQRKTIEVVFAQYCDEFRIRVNYAKRFEGFFTRISTKICAKTFKQFLNLINGRPINQTKHALAA